MPANPVYTLLSAEFGVSSVPEVEIAAAFPRLQDYSAAIGRAFDARQALRRIWLDAYRPGWRSNNGGRGEQAGF